MFSNYFRYRKKTLKSRSSCGGEIVNNQISADKRSFPNQNALEEARPLLEHSDKRSMIEQELADTNETLSDQMCKNQAISLNSNFNDSKCPDVVKEEKLSEQGLNALGHDLDEMISEVQISSDKAQLAMIDAARLADEPKAAMMLEKDEKQRLSATLNMKLIEDEPSHQTWLLPEVICTSGLPVRSQDADILSRKIRGHLWRSAYTPPDIVTPSSLVLIRREGDKFSEIVEELLLEKEIGLSFRY